MLFVLDGHFAGAMKRVVIIAPAPSNSRIHSSERLRLWPMEANTFVGLRKRSTAVNV